MNSQNAATNSQGFSCPCCHARGSSLFDPPALRLFESAVIGEALGTPATLAEVAKGPPGQLTHLSRNYLLWLLLGNILAALLVNIDQPALEILAQDLSEWPAGLSTTARIAAGWAHSHSILNLAGFVLLLRCFAKMTVYLHQGDPETNDKWYRDHELEKLRESACAWRGCARCKTLWHSDTPTLALPWSADSMKAAIAGGSAFCDWEAAHLLEHASSIAPMAKRPARRL